MAITWNKIIPRWGGDTIEPPEAKKDVGYIAGDNPPASWENWLRKGTYEALDETRDVIENIDSQLAQTAKTYIKNTRPTTNDDETLDYKQGDVWIYEDYTDEEDYTYEAYKCLDARDGFAKWEKFAEDVKIPPVIYGVRIDTTNSNPATAVTYTDDAVGMIGGSTDWDTKFPFNQIKPCMLKNGVVQYYLNPNNYAQKADGSPADITSGNDGDVMIEIPKMAYMIYTEGNYTYVKITDSPNAKAVDSRFLYYAHTRDAEGDRDKLYIGAYLGFSSSGKLRSLSGKTPTANQAIGTFRTQAQANGTGYDLLSFYPITLLQCLFALRYKDLDSQTVLGRGNVDGIAPLNTGGADTKGFYFGETTGLMQMKFLGIEDLWGNLEYFVDGAYCDANRNLLTAFKNFNDDASGYANRGQLGVADTGGYLSKIQGDSSKGFIAKESSGSATTFYCDNGAFTASRFMVSGGTSTSQSGAGAFRNTFNKLNTTTQDGTGARLMYL